MVVQLTKLLIHLHLYFLIYPHPILTLKINNLIKTILKLFNLRLWVDCQKICNCVLKNDKICKDIFFQFRVYLMSIGKSLRNRCVEFEFNDKLYYTNYHCPKINETEMSNSPVMDSDN